MERGSHNLSERTADDSTANKNASTKATGLQLIINTIKKVLFSTRTMGTALILYALSMAVATFIENDFGTPVAKEAIYNSWWFELIMVILIINFLGNIVRYKLYRKEKWSLLLFHLAFIFIFIGGAITRYISFEGTMHIREGEAENRIISEATFLRVQIADSTTVQNHQQQLSLMPDNVPGYLRKSYSAQYDFQHTAINLKLLSFIPRAQDSIVPDANASLILHMVTNENGVRKNIYLPSGSSKTLQGVEVGFNKAVAKGVSISEANGELYINSALPGHYMLMANQQQDSIKAVNTTEPFHLRALYNIENGPMIVIPEFPTKGTVVHYEGDIKKNAMDPDLVTFSINTHDTIAFYGGSGYTDYQASLTLPTCKIAIGYGSRYYYTPFYVQLNKFELEKYPGSNAPSSFASQITVHDGEQQMPYRIFMNHVLDYKGFRFFQSSYDTDEQGTVLSVNHDEEGTLMTYIGYTMLFFGMFVSLFWKGTRFSILKQQLSMIAAKKTIILLLLFCSFSSLAIAQSKGIDKQHADNFGYLPVQNIEGRIEPANTLALEILRKLYHHDNINQFNANQFLLSITTNPVDWLAVPLIKINKRGGDELLKLTKANADGLTTIINLLKVDGSGDAHFLLENEYNISFAKKAADQTNYDKEVIEINDKMQAAQYLLNGQYLRIIPGEGATRNTWTAFNVLDEPKTAAEGMVFKYYQNIKAGNWQQADATLQEIKSYQLSHSGDIMPSQTKLNWEVRYNNWDLFLKLMIFYSMVGGFLLLMSFASLFNQSKPVRYIIRTLIAALVIAAIIQATGLAVRWYISGHAPWSNGYEAVMFISLIGLVAGLLLYKNSNSFIPAAGALIAVIMMGFAHGGAQMNPQITPLVPVLKSYWLMIHVAIITASYGFFGLCALIGMVVMLLNIINNKKRKNSIDLPLRELTIVNELSMTIGLFMLTIGTFLGGIWANESWGRYWSWDPKETWAFISVIVYAFVLHVRLIPGMQGKFLFNFLSLISFSTVIMTYFGVNYYLSGLHSYAKGDPMPIPAWIYITIAVVTVVTVAAWFRKKKLTA